MTTKDLFRLIIKIFGLYFLVTLIFTIPGNLLFSFNNIDLTIIISILLYLLICAGLFVLIIYYPDFIIDLLKLNKGFDEERIDLANFNNTNILKLAVVIIGGIMLIKNIPAFLTNLFFAFKSSINPNNSTIKFGSLNDYIRLSINFLNIIIGFLLIANYKIIGLFLDKKNNNVT